MSINIGELIDKKQTLILDNSGISKDKMIFIGTLVTNLVVAYFRFERPKEYKPLSLYIDECHNFINPNLFDILKEGRRYKISACLATQDFAIIDEKMARTMCNVGNIVSYRLGYREAQQISKELDIQPQLIQFIEKYHAVYLTPKERGIAKAPRPPFIRQKEPPKWKEPQRKAKPSWFPLESCLPA